MEIGRALGLLLGLCFGVIVARPIVSGLTSWISVLFLDPNKAAKEEYDVFFNRGYLKPHRKP